MTKEIVRKRIKMLAKMIAAQAFFPVLFVIVLQMASTMLFSLLANEISARYFPKAVWQLGNFSFNYMFPLISILINALLLPLHLGVAEFLQLLIRGKKPPVSGIFHWFSDGEKLSVVFSYFLFTTVLTLVMTPLSDIPYQYINRIYFEVIADLQNQIEAGATTFVVNPALFNWPVLALSGVLLFLGMLVSIRFVPIVYLLVDRPKEGAFAAAKRSWELMKGHTWEYLILLLSFSGWYIALPFTFFLAGLYLLPYLHISIVIFVSYIQSDPILQQNAKVTPEKEGGV